VGVGAGKKTKGQEAGSGTATESQALVRNLELKKNVNPNQTSKGGGDPKVGGSPLETQKPP